MDGGKAFGLDRGRRQVDQTMQCYRRHDVDEQTADISVRRFPISYTRKRGMLPGDLVQRMEDHRVPPHGDSDGIVAISKTVGADQESLRLRGNPDGAQHQQVDKVAKVRQEVVVPSFVVRVVPNRHEIAELSREPDVEVFGMCTNEVSGDENIEDAGDKRELLPHGNRLGVIPLRTEAVD